MTWKREWYDVDVIKGDLTTSQHTVLLASEEEAYDRMNEIYDDVSAIIVRRVKKEEANA